MEELTEYEKDNEILRQEIKARQKRFLGRRPIKFVMPEELQQTGLMSVNLRFDPTTGLVKSLFKLEEGDVEIPMDSDFHINITSPSKDGMSSSQMKPYYENLVLKLVRIWATSNEVKTSEGIVDDGSGNSANMGHFAYLRIQDGKKYEFSEKQRKICLEEQGLDLADESDRLAMLDPTGYRRNSTYVRENYDPSKPPLDIYYSSLD